MTKDKIIQIAFKKIGIVSSVGSIPEELNAEGHNELDLLFNTWKNRGIGFDTLEEYNLDVKATTTLLGVDGKTYKAKQTAELTLDRVAIIGDDYRDYFEEDTENTATEGFGDEVIGTDGAVYFCIKDHFSDATKAPTGSQGEFYWKQITSPDTYSILSGGTYTIINASSVIDMEKTRSGWQTNFNYATKIGEDMINSIDLSLPEEIYNISEVDLYEEDLFVQNLQRIDKQDFFNAARIYDDMTGTSFYCWDTSDHSIKLFPFPETTGSFSLKILAYKNIFAADEILKQWENACVYGLASRLAENNGLPMNEQQKLAAIAEDELRLAESLNAEINSVEGYNG